MALNMTLSATTNTITATVGGLDPAYEGYRTFKFFVDNTLKSTERVEGGEAIYTKTLSNIYFDSLHAVRCEIWNADASTLFATLNGTVRTGTITISYWDWTRSNGTATALQTAAAHAALTQAKVSGMRGKTSDFNYRVWNDLTNKLYALITGVGLPWDGEHNTVASRDELTAADMNTLVKNCNYPIWTWRDDPSHEGYLGRLAFRGVHQYGKSGDYVYGHYIIELARVLNVLISVYTDTNTVHAAADTALNISTTAAAKKPRSANANAGMALTLITEAALEAKRKGDLTAASLLTIAMHSALRSSESARAAGSINLRLSTSAYGRASHSARVTASGALALTQDADMDATESLLLDAATALAIAAQAALDVKRKGDLTAGTVVTLAHGANAEQSAPVHASSGTFVFLLPEADISQEMCAEEAAAVSLSVATTALLEATVGEWRLPYWVGDGMLHVPQSKQVVQTGTRIKIT